MITIIHGDDVASSRQFFMTMKNKFPDAVSLPIEETTVTALTQIFEGGSLFEESKIVFFENFLSKLGKKKDSSGVLEYIKTHASHDIYFWEGKSLTPGVINQFKGAINQQFKLPQVLFRFLDQIMPGNKYAVALFHEALQTADVEIIFYMIVRHFRLLLALTNTGKEQIDEVKNMPPWQKTKLQKQASLFTKDDLVQLYLSLFTIDHHQKTGQLPVPTPTAIDFFLLAI